MEDHEIVALYWRRDEQAIVESDRKYGAFCRKIALNILTVREDAEECVNDAWGQAWGSIPPQRPVYLRAWLGKVVRNLALNRWNRNHAQKRYSGPERLLSELEDCLPAPNGVEETLENQALAQFLNGWLAELQPEDRKLFLRRYWNGDPVKELARERGASPNKISQELFRLRKKLRAALEKEGFSL